MNRTFAIMFACSMLLQAGCAFDAEGPEDAWTRDMYVPDVFETWHQDPIDQESLCASHEACADLLATQCGPSSGSQCFTCCDESAWGRYLTTRCCPTDVIQPDVPPDACDVDEGCVTPDPGPDADIPFDTTTDDLAPDCGPIECIDCTCDCGNDVFLPYGGCYNGCNVAPDDVADCSRDCVAMCGFEPGRECGQYGGWQECPDGQACVEEPCPNCGMPPRSFCVLPPCEATGCYLDDDCLDERVCYGASVSEGTQGSSLTLPADAGECWMDSDCPPNTTCAGASFCGPCSQCLVMDQSGHCAATGDLDKVLLWLGTSMTAPGSTLHPKWFNFTDTPVFLPGCGTYSIQRLHANDGWVDLGVPVDCIWEGIAIRLLPGTAFSANPLTNLPESGNGWTDNYRLLGEYWIGCGSGLPLGEAGCTGGPFEVFSEQVFFGMAP